MQVLFFPLKCRLCAAGLLAALCLNPAWAQPQGSSGDVDNATQGCINSFNETREQVLKTNAQSVIMLSSTNGIAPYITLQTLEQGRRYVLWQSLNGEIKGYALRDGKGFDYTNSANVPLPLSWHPTLIWDNLFSSRKDLRNYSCVLTGRTRVMGKRVSLLRLIPQEGLRYSFMIAKEDESDFPVELTIIDHKGNVASRLTTMDSRIISGVEFPVSDSVFDRIEQSGMGHVESMALSPGLTGGQELNTSNNQDSPASEVKDQVIRQSELSSDQEQSESQEDAALQLMLPAPTRSAGVTVAADGSSQVLSQDLVTGSNENQADKVRFKTWPELNIPNVYQIVDEGTFVEGGQSCLYQEFSDGMTSFRVYRNQRSTVFYPVLTNGTITIVRRNSPQYEYSVVGEVPVNLAEFVLTKISD